MDYVGIREGINFPVRKYKFQVQRIMSVVNGFGRHCRNWVYFCRIAKLVPNDKSKSIVIQDELRRKLLLQLLSGHIRIRFLKKKSYIGVWINFQFSGAVFLQGLPDMLCHQLPYGLYFWPHGCPDYIGLIDLTVPSIEAVASLSHKLIFSLLCRFSIP